jgi:hyperosmotically inducible protein
VRRRVGGLFGIAAVVLTAAACSTNDPGVTTAVKAKLASDDSVKANRIDVDTEEGVVTLTGSVDTPATKARALELARSSDGVVRVVDQLTVEPAPAATSGAGEATRDATRDVGRAGTDAAVTTAVKTKFLADTDISGLKIDVDTKDGVVTLTGVVPTRAEKQKALSVAKKTEGVTSVVDRLKVGKDM